MDEDRIKIDRITVLLEPDPADEREVDGILNPAVAGKYLLYRAVGRGNYSRIMAAQLMVEETDAGTRVTAQKLNRVVLEPTEIYEQAGKRAGGIEDPRVTELSDGTYIMFYTGYGRPAGFTVQVPLVALATSRNGLDWERHGRIMFETYEHRGSLIDFNIIPNKDTVLFSERVNDRYALLHRPMFTREQAVAYQLPWRAIWYAESDKLAGPWGYHRLVMEPHYDWEHGGVGAGVPPIHLRDTWLHIYHGFALPTEARPHRRYSAGIFVTPHHDPDKVIFRSGRALLEPTIPEEQVGVVPHVVFPTAVWQQNVEPDTLALFWGAADTRIVWGVLHLPGKALKPYADMKHSAV
jgi:beta-1,2-mannobiose phosphorylase / 1,2-beta-oligomannan phosphorylase